MSLAFDPEDFSFVVKMRGAPAKPWVWEIHRAGKSGPVQRSPVCYESMAEAVREGKKSPGTPPHGGGVKGTGRRHISRGVNPPRHALRVWVCAEVRRSALNTGTMRGGLC